MKEKPERPSTANTMMLVLKPREEEYKNVMPLSGSQNELEAWRKNRVIQMKLGAYLAEVKMQKKSTARLLKTEEYRFLQEVNRRSSVPRSVVMMEQLDMYKDKTIPGAGTSLHNGPESARDRHVKHAPLSARTPVRPRNFMSLLERPQTSASMIRKSTEDRGELEDLEDVPEMPDNVLEEKVYPLVDDGKPSPIQNRHIAGLPHIRSSDSLKVDLALMEDASKSEAEAEFHRRNSMSLDRSNSSSKFSMAMKHKKDLLSRSSSMSKIAPVGRFNGSDAPIHEEVHHSESFGVDIKLDEFIVAEINNFDSPTTLVADATITDNTQTNDNVFGPPTASAIVTDRLDNEDEKLSIIDLDVLEGAKRPDSPEKKPPKKMAKVNKPKPTFNKPKSEPSMPLRENITSVLRKERTRYENTQNKVKNYLHKMKSSDFMTKGHNPRDTASAASRSHNPRDTASAASRRSSAKKL